MKKGSLLLLEVKNVYLYLKLYEEEIQYDALSTIQKGFKNAHT